MSFDLDPVMFQSDFNNSLMRNPDYASFLTRDFYIEPVSLEEVGAAAAQSAATTVQLKKGDTKIIGDAAITFVQFDMNHKGMDAKSAAEGFAVGAVLEVKRGTSVERLTPVTFYKGAVSTQVQAAHTKDGALGFELVKMNVDSESKGSVIELNVIGPGGVQPSPAKSEVLVIEASVKPFMSLVWAGAVFMILGLGISLSTKLNGSSSG